MQRRAISSLAALCCALVPAVADANETPSPRSAAASPPAAAAGLIVSASGPVSRGVQAQVEATLGRTIVGQSEMGGSLIALRFDRPLPAATVRSSSAELSALPEIGSVTPDLVVTPDALPDDPYFDGQINLWSSNASVFSVDAPAIWRSTTGTKSVVVAVVDGGIVNHPDLTGQAVAGYDMISDTRVSRDGNGRDSNPADPGNWSSGTYCTASSSTWHGTHVTGIIGAKRNNGIGIAGIAPGVSLQPVRVIGQCGGVMSDIIAGIRWASGGHVSGVPDNTRPADVINLSLSSAVSDYSCPTVYQDVIDEARSRGAVVVVSAGNQSASVLTRTPSNCNGVLSVGASAPDGSPTTYTNVGKTLGMMAPGGLLPSQGAGIWSTVDTGTTTPSSSTYRQMSGTSMAAPAVSAGAALVFSLGSFTDDQVIQVLKASAARPPTFDGYYTCFSTDAKGVEHNVCGAGILDLGGIPSPIGHPALSGGTAVGSTLSFVPPLWNGEPDSVTYQWLREGVAITGATGTSYVVAKADIGRTLSVRSTSHGSGFPDFSGLSATRAIPKVKATLSLRLSSTRPRINYSRLTAAMTVTAEQGQPTSGSIGVYVDGTRVTTVAVASDGTTRATLPVFKKTGTHSVRAYYGGNSRVSSVWSATVYVTAVK